MPPKQKIFKEDILKTAFNIVKENGIEHLNARNIAKTLSCSTQPIFSYYTNMEDLKSDVFEMTNKYHSNYFNNTELNNNIFLNVGLTYINFAVEEPNLFKFLFMSGQFSGKNLNEYVTADPNDHISDNLPNNIDTFPRDPQAIFTDMWLYAHGIASMLVFNHINLEFNEIKDLLENMFNSLINNK